MFSWFAWKIKFYDWLLTIAFPAVRYEYDRHLFSWALVHCRTIHVNSAILPSCIIHPYMCCSFIKGLGYCSFMSAVRNVKQLFRVTITSNEWIIEWKSERAVICYRLLCPDKLNRGCMECKWNKLFRCMHLCMLKSVNGDSYVVGGQYTRAPCTTWRAELLIKAMLRAKTYSPRAPRWSVAFRLSRAILSHVIVRIRPRLRI